MWGLAARTASAQANPAPPRPAFSSGPFQLQARERVLIGLLLPAVQKVREAASFTILDSAGMPVFSARLEPQAGNANAPVLSSFFDITLEPDPNMAGGTLVIRGKGTAGGGDILAEVASADGILIGLLLPAVQRNGKVAAPLAASMQSFNAAGGTMTLSSFFD